jgi:dTDP-4-dehydrorhamnose reductase
MARILVTGATGLLGMSLAPLLAQRGHTVLRHGFRAGAELQADLRERGATAAMLDAAQPEVVVNLAALTNVDACEGDPDAAYRLNTLSVENLAHWLRGRAGSHLVHISTDMLYDGAGPHREDAIVVRNTYALSKVAAEIAAAGVGASVLRTNFFGRSLCPGRASFSDWLAGALRARSPVTVFDDVLFSPLSINTLCAMIALVAERRPAGVFNLGSREGMSKADFAFALADTLGLDGGAMTRGRSGAALKAYRPKDMRMDCSLFEQTMGLQLPALIDEIHTLRSDYRE